METSWYVAQVFTGQEEKVKGLCEKQIPQDVLTEAFLPYYEEMKRYEGAWHKEKKLLFPGYLFLVTGQVDELRLALGRVEAFTRILGDTGYLLPLTDAEVAFLKGTGGEEHVVEMSTGIIENSQVTITSGPLMGREGSIRKIDRHKRVAVIELEMFGRNMEATVGLEIVRKS